MIRAVGGALFLAGALVGAFNLWKTAKRGSLVAEEQAQAPALAAQKEDHAVKNVYGHRFLESRPVQFFILTVIAVAIGGVIEFVPAFLIKSNIPTISSVKPYTPLELHGRDIYIREGCYTCHSQLIRPFRSETERYGEYSKAGEFVYDHPFQWGSKRIGPDLHRLGGKYPDAWHYNHMKEPRSTSPGSIMPPYPWLFEQTVDTAITAAKINVMRTMGVPYPEGYEKFANQDVSTQAKQIVESLKSAKIEISEKKEIVALIAYLQRLGQDIKGEKKANLGTNSR
jgi:cytochrome c oxidase cbb3-type subunit I/II